MMQMAPIEVQPNGQSRNKEEKEAKYGVEREIKKVFHHWYKGRGKRIMHV